MDDYFNVLDGQEQEESRGYLPVASIETIKQMLPYTVFTDDTMTALQARLATAGFVDLPYTIGTHSVELAASPLPSTVIIDSTAPASVAVVTGQTTIDEEATDDGYQFTAQGALLSLPVDVCIVSALNALGAGLKPYFRNYAGSVAALGDMTERIKKVNQLTESVDDKIPVMIDKDGVLYLPKAFIQLVSNMGLNQGVFEFGDNVPPGHNTPGVPTLNGESWGSMWSQLINNAPDEWEQKLLRARNVAESYIPAIPGAGDVLFMFSEIWRSGDLEYYRVRIGCVKDYIQLSTNFPDVYRPFTNASYKTGTVTTSTPLQVTAWNDLDPTAQVPISGWKISLEISTATVDPTVVFSNFTGNTAEIVPGMSFPNPITAAGLILTNWVSSLPNYKSEGFFRLDGGAAVLPVSGQDIAVTFPTWEDDKRAVSDLNGTEYTDFYPSALYLPADGYTGYMMDGTASYLPAANQQVWCQAGLPNEWSAALIVGGLSAIFQELTEGGGLDWPTEEDPLQDIPTDFSLDADAADVGMIAIYNPSRATLQAFSAWLWGGGSVLDKLKNYFASPAEAVISLMRLYVTPAGSGASTIHCGYVDSGIACNTVAQHTTFSCGSVSVPQYFGSCLDYAPYTQVELYLPFIGFIQLNPDVVVGHTVGVEYGIDVLSGSCLAKVTCDGVLIHTADGSCGMSLPVTAGNMVQSIGNAITGTLAGLATGGGLGAAMGVVNGVTHFHPTVSVGGTVGQNTGCFGPKSPFILITRPYPADAQNYQHFDGFPINKTVRLNQCSGYTRVKSVHLDNCAATSAEVEKIEQLLKDGVIV